MTQLALELDPASDWCQRWNGRSHSWRHKSEGGFNPDDYTVEPIGDDNTAKAFVLEHHYSGTYPAAKHRFGLYDRLSTLVGVMILGIPQKRMLTNVFPDLRPFYESTDLARFILLDEVPGNGESWFLGQVRQQAYTVGVRGIVSLADPRRRVVDGRLIFPGHVGTIYQATNALYCGRSTAATKKMFPDGSILDESSCQKVRDQARGHAYVERKLVKFGATPMRAGDRPNLWLRTAIRDANIIPLPHKGNHRYVFTLGSRTERRHIRIAVPNGPYPKEVDR